MKKSVITNFDTHKYPDVKFYCDCCVLRIKTSGYILNTGETICHHCRESLKSLTGYTTLTESQARILGVTKQQAEFFGVRYIENIISKNLTKEERQRLDHQAKQDQDDLFG